MKKFIAVLLASAVSVCAFAFVGCGDKNTDENFNSDNPKPTMPTDKDMQSVSAENILQEMSSCYKQLVSNGCGQYKAYASYEMNYKNDKYIGNTVSRDSEAYGGIKDGENTTAAFTHISTRGGEDKTVEGVVEYNKLNRSVSTGIQKNSQLYRFFANRSEDENSPVGLSYYEDNAAWEQVYDNKIPCLVVSSEYGFTSAYSRAANWIEGAVEYAKENIIYSLYEDVEIGEASQVTVESFELVAKKSDKKFFASAKYTLNYQPTELYHNTAKSVSEYSVLIDYNAPKSVSTLPSSGIDINNLSLPVLADNALYLDVTSEQLTNAVKDGKQLTVNVAGNGNVSNFGACGIGGMYDTLPVTDGQVTLDCAKLKADIEKYDKQYESMGISKFYYRLTYYYNYDNVVFSGKVYINY